MKAVFMALKKALGRLDWNAMRGAWKIYSVCWWTTAARGEGTGTGTGRVGGRRGRSGKERVD